MQVHLLKDFREISLLNSDCLCLCIQLPLFTCCNICLQDRGVTCCFIVCKSASGFPSVESVNKDVNNWPTKECVQQIACKGRWPFPSPDHPGCFSSLSVLFSLSLSLSRWRVMAHSYLLSAWRAAAECFWLDERLLMLISPSHFSRQDGLTAGGGNVFHCQENLMVHGILHFFCSLAHSLTHSLTCSDKNWKSHYRHNWFSSAKE